MTNLIENLGDHDMQCIMISAGVPSDDRVVAVHDIYEVADQSGRVVKSLPVCVSMRYREGRWYGLLLGEDLTDHLTDRAVWSESVFNTLDGIGHHRNTK